MKALILLSGGLDSTVVLAMAKARQCQCIAISYHYGQRHLVELQAAKAIAKYYEVAHHLIKIDSSIFGKSSLTSSAEVPKGRSVAEMSEKVPPTYVPARNTLFLSYALAMAEYLEADEIHIGANALDNAYPDCRPSYFEAFQKVMDLATKQAIDGKPPKIVAPLLHDDKVGIIKKGQQLKVPFELTFSCYDPIAIGAPCGQCDACILRKKGFEGAGSSVPLC